jgi:hypothetical protein
MVAASFFLLMVVYAAWAVVVSIVIRGLSSEALIRLKWDGTGTFWFVEAATLPRHELL